MSLSPVSSDLTAGPSPIRILVVDDHTLFRRGLTAILSRSSELAIVGDAADAGEAQRRATELKPDLILLDNHLPGVNGVDALPALRAAQPQVRIILLTVSEDENDLAAALRGGANGYLLKTMDADALVSSILRVMRGESVVAEEMTSKLVAVYRGAASVAGVAGIESESAAPSSPLSQLSPRELEILRGIAPGREQQADRPATGNRRDDGQDSCATHPAETECGVARAGRRYRNQSPGNLIWRKPDVNSVAHSSSELCLYCPT